MIPQQQKCDFVERERARWAHYTITFPRPIPQAGGGPDGKELVDEVRGYASGKLY